MRKRSLILGTLVSLSGCTQPPPVPPTGGADMFAPGASDASLPDLATNPKDMSTLASGTHIWSRRMGGVSEDYPSGIATDNAGNTIVIGQFKATADFGTGPLTSAGDADIFVAKFGVDGAPLWSHRYGGARGDYALAVTTDRNGNIVLSGLSDTSIDFGSGAIAGNYLVKLNANGGLVWAKQANLFSAGIATDTTGNIIVPGALSGTADFGGGALTSNGGTDMVIVKYDPNGNHVWSKNYGGGADEIAFAATIDQAGDIVVVGNGKEGSSAGGETLHSPNSDVLLLAKYSPSGEYRWSKLVPTQSGMSSGFPKVAVSTSGSIATASIPSSDTALTYLAAHQANGADYWSKGRAVGITNYGLDVAFTPSGNVVFATTCTTTLDLGDKTITCPGTGSYIISLTAAGSYQWHKLAKMIPPYARLTTDMSGNILVTSGFTDTADFGGGPLTSAGNSDIYLLKLAP